MTALEIAAIAAVKALQRPRIVALFEVGHSVAAIAEALNEDVLLVNWTVSRWWHETAPHRRGPLYADRAQQVRRRRQAA